MSIREPKTAFLEVKGREGKELVAEHKRLAGEVICVLVGEGEGRGSGQNTASGVRELYVDGEGGRASQQDFLPGTCQRK